MQAGATSYVLWCLQRTTACKAALCPCGGQQRACARCAPAARACREPQPRRCQAGSARAGLLAGSNCCHPTCASMCALLNTCTHGPGRRLPCPFACHARRWSSTGGPRATPLGYRNAPPDHCEPRPRSFAQRRANQHARGQTTPRELQSPGAHCVLVTNTLMRT